MAVSALRIDAQTESSWGSPILDIHLHFSDSNLDHINGCGVAKAVLLTPVSVDDQAKAKMAKYPDRFVRFTRADITMPDAIDGMHQAVKNGAIGLGEIKFKLPLDGPEMRRVYDLAAELSVPVLIHFQEVEHFAGEGLFSTGFTRLPAILKAYPKTIFIGHADYFWANISAVLPGDVAYPTGKVKPGGLTDRMLSDYPNLYGDLSANSGRNALARDPEFTSRFLVQHQSKLMFGSDCSCKDGHGAGQASKEPLIWGKCVARETLAALKELAAPEVFRKITWGNGVKLLGLEASNSRARNS